MVELVEENNSSKDEPVVETKFLKSSKPTVTSNGIKSEQDRKMTEDINNMLRDMPLTEDTTCGFWIFKGTFFQRFANRTAYVILYGFVGLVFGIAFAYFNGTLTTLEKRFKIPSRNMGIITIGNNISQILASTVISYYGGKGHRPRWMGFGVLTIVSFCLLNALPHFLYGPGEDALALTAEFGGIPDANATLQAIEEDRQKTLCRLKGGAECEIGEGSLTPQVILFIAYFTSGIGSSLYYALGSSYMDDNMKKSKAPAMLSISYFLHMLGPAFGYALASFCLGIYIAPQLQPIIDNTDPRWMGAWWMGWLLLAFILLMSGLFFAMFPKELPRPAARRMIEEDHRRLEGAKKSEMDKLMGIVESKENLPEESKASFKDMLKTFQSLITNKTLMFNNISSVFYCFGYMPYWVFTPKYIEMQYRQSAATSSMVTGTVALVFSAVGILLAGLVISKYKPSARYMAAWNVFVGIMTVVGILCYAFIGCPGNETSMVVNIHDSALNDTATCNSICNCDYVQYSPVCGENSKTYISPCHAGCKKVHVDSDGKKTYYDCSCIPTGNYSTAIGPIFKRLTAMDLQPEVYDLGFKNDSFWNESPSTTSPTIPDPDVLLGGQSISGVCPVNCYMQLVTFLAVMCCLKFIGATGRASNFLVSVRCVPEKDKTAAIGFGMMFLGVLTFIPSPIFYGWLFDRLCLVWGKTCTNKGNCWLYDSEAVRYYLNTIAAAFIAIGTFFDCGVWYYVKDLKIFDEEVNEVEMKIVDEEVDSEKKPEI